MAEITTPDSPSIETCSTVATDEGRYDTSECAILEAELRALRRKADRVDRLTTEVFNQRANRFWNESYSTTTEQANERARRSMVRDGLLPAD